VIQRWDRGTTRQDVVCSGRGRIQKEGDVEAQILQRMREALGIENPVGTDVWLEAVRGGTGPESGSHCDQGRIGLGGYSTVQ
jgi:hypothetical protein